MNKWAWQCLLALILIVWLPVPATAAETPAPAASVVQDNKPIPLIVNNETIMVFRSAFLGMSPSERAEGARTRIKQFLQDYGYGSINAESSPQGMAVTINHDVMFVVTPGDIRDIPGANLYATAHNAAQALRDLESKGRVNAIKEKVTGFKISTKWLLVLLGLTGIVGFGIYSLRSAVFAEDPGLVRCPKCDNMNEALIRFQEEPSSFRVMRKYYCDACGNKWLKKG